MKRVFFLVLGWFALVLGIAGFFLPLLPATPFFIVAAYGFSKSDRRLYEWLSHHKYFGPPLRDWKKHRVIKPHVKIISLLCMVGGTVSIWLNPLVNHVAVKIIVTALMAAVAIFILWQRSVAPHSSRS